MKGINFVHISVIFGLIALSNQSIMQFKQEDDLYESKPHNCHKKNCKSSTPKCYFLSELDIKPKFLGKDIASFSNWVNQNISILEMTRQFSGKHRILTSFIVLSNGHISNVTILEGLYQPLDTAAIQIISNSPTWEPGYKNGRPVNCKIEYPILLEFR